MNKKSSDSSESQNLRSLVNRKSSEFSVSDGAEVIAQTKKLGELDLTSSRERTKSTNDSSTKSPSVETSKQPTLQISECSLKNWSRIRENIFEGSQSYEIKNISRFNYDLQDIVLKSLSQSENLFLNIGWDESDIEPRSGDDHGSFEWSESDIEQEGSQDDEEHVIGSSTGSDYELLNHRVEEFAIKFFKENENDFHFEDEFSWYGKSDYDEDKNMMKQPDFLDGEIAEAGSGFIGSQMINWDFGKSSCKLIGIPEDMEKISVKEDDPVSQSRLQKNAKPLIYQNTQSPNSRGNRKKRGPKPSFTYNLKIELVQLKNKKSHKKEHPDDWKKDMRRDLEKFENFGSMVTDPLFNTECNGLFNTFKTQNPGINYDLKEPYLQNEPRSICGDTLATIAQPLTKPKKENFKKKLKTINPSLAPQTSNSKKFLLFDSPTQMDSENESEDGYSQFQDLRENERETIYIQNKNLNVINEAVSNSPLQPQPEAKVPRRRLNDDEISKQTFGTSGTRTSSVSVVINQMFALLKDKKLGKEFRNTIKQETWFKYLVQRANRFGSVQKAYENSERVLQREKLYKEALDMVKRYDKVSQIGKPSQEALQGYQVCLARVNSYERALQAAQQCRKEMGCMWYQEALCWESLLSLVDKNKRLQSQDQCKQCCQSSKCDECREFENLCNFLHAIYKKGFKKITEEKKKSIDIGDIDINDFGKIRSLRKLSKVVGNERFSEGDYVFEMDLKEFYQKAASSVMAIFLKEEKRFYDIAFEELYHPRRNSEKQSNEGEVLDDSDKKMLYLRYKRDVRVRFATPKDYFRISAKKKIKPIDSFFIINGSFWKSIGLENI